MSYWSEQLRQQRFDLDSEALRPWFPLPQVLDGLFNLCGRLFDIRINAADGEAPIWHETCAFSASVMPAAVNRWPPSTSIPSAAGQLRGGAWMDDCLGRHISPDGARCCRWPI